MEIAFGLKEILDTWAPERGAMRLRGAGGAEFMANLQDALRDEQNCYLWQLRGFKCHTAERAIPAFDRGDILRCRYTNWEFIMFSRHRDLWARTTWWLENTQVRNPLLDLWPWP